MNLFSYLVFTLAITSFAPTTSLSTTKLTIGHSTINPRITPPWITQEKCLFQKVWYRRNSDVCPQHAAAVSVNLTCFTTNETEHDI